MSTTSSCRHLGPVIGLVVLSVLPSCVQPESDAPTGLAFLRISTLQTACPTDVDPGTGLPRIPTNLPYRRTKATASYRASSLYAGGHSIAIGYRDDDGYIGMVQAEVPPETGYGISPFPDRMLALDVGFGEWRDGAFDFAGRAATGYFNYFSSDENINDLPGKIYALLAFDGKNAANADICRIVAIHAAAEYERVTSYDPSWLERRRGLLISTAGGTVTPPALDNLTPPGNAPVAPADAPMDPGAIAPALTVHRPNAFSNSSDGSSSPCD